MGHPWPGARPRGIGPSPGQPCGRLLTVADDQLCNSATSSGMPSVLARPLRLASLPLAGLNGRRVVRLAMRNCILSVLSTRPLDSLPGLRHARHLSSAQVSVYMSPSTSLCSGLGVNLVAAVGEAATSLGGARVGWPPGPQGRPRFPLRPSFSGGSLVLSGDGIDDAGRVRPG